MSDENFTGLRWEPCYEEEVVILFGLILPYLEEKIVIEEFTGDFPDCRAKVDGEVISMEFEVYASNFFAHKHHNSSRLQECKRIICWRNNIPWKTTNRDGHEFLTINGHEVEIVNLKKIVDDLKNKEFLEFIKEGPRPYIRESNREMIFEQLKNKVDEDKYSLIQELLKFVEGRKEFTIDWGGGKRWYTMRFFLREWGMDPLGVLGDGSVNIVYKDNPAILKRELPYKTQKELRKIFKHREKSSWPNVPLNNQEDLDRIKMAIDIMAEDSKQEGLVWG